MASRRFHWRVQVLPTLMAAALAAGIFGLAPTAVGGPPSCAVSNVGTHAGYSSLQAAVNAAAPGDTLEVSGTCVGNTTVDRDITIKGEGRSPTLDGGRAGTVVHITDGTTTLEDLTITNGVASAESVEGNPCCVGGGIAISGPTAAARLVDSLVTGNSAGVFGGGIDVDDGTLTLVDSTVSGNTSSSSGGIDSDFGTITLIDSTVSGNVATGGGTCTAADLSCAGGIWNFGGTLTLIDSTVTRNTADDRGGGIVNQQSGAVTTLSGTSTISSNRAGEFGGGIWVRSGTVTATADWDGSVEKNKPDQCFPTVTIGSTTCGA